MNALFIEALGLAAPGLSGWNESTTTLRGDAPYSAAPLSAFTPSVLPANEQRRATATVRLAFRVAEEAIRNCTHSAASLATVFASADADMLVSHRICTALSQTQRLVSPTDFHNSVHNAPSGYWHIGAKSHLPSSAVAGHDYSFAIGLIEAMTQTQTESQKTLLVCYDVPAPQPLLEKRPLSEAFAVALLLSSQRSPSAIATIRIASMNSGSLTSTMDDTHLESLRVGNPAARALPLLRLLAAKQSGTVVLQRSSDRAIALELTTL